MNLQKRMGWLVVVVIGLALASLGCQASASGQYNGILTNGTQPQPDFELMATSGKKFRLSDVEGDIALIYFGYTRCPDVCPLTMWEIKKALNTLDKGRERVHVIFITADPERDTPEILSNYMAAFGPEFIGLTDDFEKVQGVMKSYGASAEKEEVADSQLGYLVSHTATLFLVDAEGRLRLQYPFGFKAEDLAADLAALLAQETL